MTNATTIETTTREEALLSFLGLGEAGPDDLGIESGWSENSFTVDGGEYLVLTDSEADEKAAEYIADSLWAFNADFLSGETDLDSAVFTALQPQCESANDAVTALINATCGMSSFVESAISADGRGHFLSFYDGNEGKSGDYFIYRVN